MNAELNSMTEIRITDLNVEDVMTRNFGVVKHDASVSDVIDLILTNDWEEIFIIDESNKFVHIATKKFLLSMIKKDIDQQQPISNVCKSNIITTAPKISLIEARSVMRNFRIGRLPVIDKDRNILGVLTARDVCNGFSSKLEMLGEHLYSIMENISEAIQVIDCTGMVTYWNNSAEKMFGIQASSIQGKKLENFMPDELLLKVIADHNEYHDIITELKGGVFIVRNAVPVLSSSGEMIGAVCTSKDITVTMNLINKLDRSRTRVIKLEQVMESRECKHASDLEEKFYTVDPGTLSILKQALRVAASNATVLITGESGTGKELMAKYIYRNSPRSDKPFIEINCGAIPEALFESEMFGYESGAFTGASKNGKPGKFELAKSGTLFLDEIGELPIEMQAKFLRVLQEKNYYRVGGKTPLISDVRIVAATNRDMKKLVEENTFRKDLFYRMSVVVLEIPPLRERKCDIPGLVQLFINQLNLQYGRFIRNVDPAVIDLMTGYSWPGNVRQLHNILERIFILSEDDYITLQTLSETGLNTTLFYDNINVKNKPIIPEVEDISNNSIKLDELIDTREREVILEVLKNCDYNKSQAAQALGIPRSTLYYKMKALNIDVESFPKKMVLC
jgi:PAS domain S-box-containing protein